MPRFLFLVAVCVGHAHAFAPAATAARARVGSPPIARGATAGGAPTDPTAAAVASVDGGALRRFLGELPTLGALRFITVGPSAILETVAACEAVSYKELPGPPGAVMATLKTTDARFEAHLRLHQLAAVRMEAKEKGGKDLRFVKFISKLDGDAGLMCLLHEPDGDAVRRWEALRDAYGAEQELLS